jgi:hypothetical protein
VPATEHDQPASGWIDVDKVTVEPYICVTDATRSGA